jgi:cyclic pyranopterin phosphate synthase
MSTPSTAWCLPSAGTTRRHDPAGGILLRAVFRKKAILTEKRLVDKYNRHLSYLRVSITDRCNLACLYCVPRELVPKLTHDDILSYEEILRLVRIGAKLGITKVRVTGGEPLVRKGVFDFLAALRQLEGVTDLSLTTNGVLLKKHIDEIRDAGIRRINISMDTLVREKYARITGKDEFRSVWEGIDAAEKRGFNPIKINVVALRGINDDEILDFARLSFTRPFHIRFIEYMPMGRPRLDSDPLILTPEIKTRLLSLGTLQPVAHGSSDGPAERYRFEGALGEVGFISALSHHFCDRCNRLRLTARGRLRPCLLSDNEVDLRGPLRQGATDEQLEDIFVGAIGLKPSDHNLAGRLRKWVDGQMSSIGG